MKYIFSKINIALLSSSLYVSFQLFSNILSTKIAILPFFNLSVDGGTIIYPLTFTLRDFVHKTWGKKNARQLVVITGFLNLIMIALFWLVAKLPADSAWVNQTAYETILLPVGRIVLASVISQIVAELIDTEIFSFIYKKFNDVSAALISNFFSLIIDSILFSLLAFLGVMPFGVVGQIIIANILIKAIMALGSAPAIVLVPREVKEDEI